MLVVVGLVGALVGAVAAAFVVRRRETSRRVDEVSGLQRRTERRLAELERDGDRLRAAIDTLPQGVVVATKRGEHLVRNESARNMGGDRAGDALIEDALLEVARKASAGEAVRRHVELYGPPRRMVELNALPFDDGALIELQDVTERSRLEAVRTDFVANISHELKTPVGAIALLAETAADETDPDLLRRLAGKMQVEAHRVGRIIDDLLELSRIELGEAPLCEAVNVGLIAAEAVERVRALGENRQIRIEVKEPARRLTVMGDRRQLVSALANLMENGVKYSDPGDVVEVSATSDGQWVDLAVVDHGIGIPGRDLDRIFERFYRVDRARSRETGGTGLGLAIVRHVVTNHGGSVAVQSQEGLGSTFTLRIPAGPGPVPIALPEAG